LSYWNNKVVLITGASSGIGRGLAVQLARRGARLGLVARRASVLDEVIAEIQDAGGKAEPIIADVQDADALKSGAQRLAEVFGPIDILVANAGTGAYGDFLDLQPEWLDEMLDTNVKGFIYTIRAALPHLLASESADLVGVASIAGQRAPEGEAVYAASKHAQIGFLRSLDHELYGRGVRCSILAPGGVETEFAMGRGRTPEDPDLPGMLRAEQVADAVLYAITRPRSQRILEASILPMSDDSMG